MPHRACTQSTKHEKPHNRRLEMANPDRRSDFWCWHRIKPGVLNVTRQDCGRKEGRLAKAKVQDQKPSRAKGNCYAFLSSASTLWGERRPLERAFRTRKGFYRMLEESEYFGPVYTPAKCFCMFAIFTLGLTNGVRFTCRHHLLLKEKKPKSLLLFLL